MFTHKHACIFAQAFLYLLAGYMAKVVVPQCKAPADKGNHVVLNFPVPNVKEQSIKVWEWSLSWIYLGMNNAMGAQCEGAVHQG